MSGQQGKIGRLAFRLEGAMWNAYWARTDSMDDAVLIGSIRVSLVGHDPAIKQQFAAVMRAAIDHVLCEVYGEPGVWPGSTPAPEHERAGHG